MFRNEKSPCWQCTDRTVECHTNCERYKAYRLAKDEENAQRIMQKQIDVALRDIDRKRRHDISQGLMGRRKRE